MTRAATRSLTVITVVADEVMVAAVLCSRQSVAVIKVVAATTMMDIKVTEVVVLLIVSHENHCHDWRGCHLSNPRSRRYDAEAAHRFYENAHLWPQRPVP